MAHIRQSRLDSDLGLKAKVHESFQVDTSSLGSGHKISHAAHRGYAFTTKGLAKGYSKVHSSRFRRKPGHLEPKVDQNGVLAPTRGQEYPHEGPLVGRAQIGCE